MGEEYKELILFFFRVNHQDNLFNTLNAVCRLKQVRDLTMSRMLVRVLALLFFASHILCAPLDGRDVVGSCRYEKTSAAVFSCIRPDGKRRPPSAACCKTSLYAIDELPASGESGACCLCRYMRVKPVSSGLVMSYVLCKGKDLHIVSNRSSPFSSFPITGM